MKKYILYWVQAVYLGTDSDGDDLLKIYGCDDPFHLNEYELQSINAVPAYASTRAASWLHDAINPMIDLLEMEWKQKKVDFPLRRAANKHVLRDLLIAYPDLTHLLAEFEEQRELSDCADIQRAVEQLEDLAQGICERYDVPAHGIYPQTTC